MASGAGIAFLRHRGLHQQAFGQLPFVVGYIRALVDMDNDTERVRRQWRCIQPWLDEGRENGPGSTRNPHHGKARGRKLKDWSGRERHGLSWNAVVPWVSWAAT